MSHWWFIAQYSNQKENPQNPWILIHFLIRKHFSNQRWWLFKFSKGYPLELSPFWAKNEILNIQNLTSNNKMYQNSRLKSPKTSTCLFVKKCHNSCLELGNIKLMTLYYIRVHSSEMGGLCSRKCSSETI